MSLNFKQLLHFIYTYIIYEKDRYESQFLQRSNVNVNFHSKLKLVVDMTCEV